MFTFQGDSTANGGADNHLCADSINLAVNEQRTFFCKPIASGGYVFFINGRLSFDLVVCEVEVYSSYISSKFSLNNCIAVVIRGLGANQWVEVRPQPKQGKNYREAWH